MQEVYQLFFSHYGFQFKSIIASGAQGIVYQVFSYQYQQDFALKRVSKSAFKQSEIDCLMKMSAPHIVNLYNYYYFKDYVYLLLELCQTSLKSVIGKYQKMPLKDLVRYCYEMIISVKLCHENKIAHSDIKPSNFLIDKYGRIKICDFGLSTINDTGLCQAIKGSLGYMAPEIFKKAPYDPFKADIWALGVTFYFMATHRLPFEADDMKALSDKISSGEFDIARVENVPLRMLITKCLNTNPNLRPNIGDLLSFPFFKQNLPNKLGVKHDKKTESLSLITLSANLKLSHMKQRRRALSTAYDSTTSILPKLKRD